MKDADIIRIARGWPELTLGALRNVLEKYGLHVVTDADKTILDLVAATYDKHARGGYEPSFDEWLTNQPRNRPYTDIIMGTIAPFLLAEHAKRKPSAAKP